MSALWTYILGLARAGVEEIRDRPEADETSDSQTYDYVQIHLDVMINYHSRAKRFAASLPRNQAFAILRDVDEAERLLWQERVQGPKAGMTIQEIMMERAHIWIEHDRTWVMQPTEPARPAAATMAPRQSDATLKKPGMWATKLRNNTTLCQPYQHNQCADSSCRSGAHFCAVIVRSSGAICGMKHPACMHMWETKAGKKVRQTKKLERPTPAGICCSNRLTSDPKLQKAGKDERLQPASEGTYDDSSARASAKPVPPLGPPPQVTTPDIEAETTQRDRGRDHQDSNDAFIDADIDDGCSPPHFVDIFAGRNRPMSRAMEWCGWSTKYFEKFPAGCKCGWKCKCGKAKDIRVDHVQTEVFNHMQKAQATWIAFDSCTLRKSSSAMTGQEHLPKPLRSAVDLWGRKSLEPSRYDRRERQARSSDPLSAGDRSLLLEHNDLIAFVEEALKIIHEANEFKVQQLGIVENPESSWLWSFDFMKVNKWSQDTANDEKWTNVDYMSCFWGGIRAKKQRLRTNMHSAREALSVEGMARAQCHNHHPQEWNPKPWQEEEEYPATFVWQMAVAISCEVASRFQFRLKVPRSPALQPTIGGDRSWWSLLPASAVAELMMVPIGLQLMLCPPEDEGHIPPVIYGPLLRHLPERAACCGILAATRFRTKAEFLNPFEGEDSQEVAVLKYIDAWLRKTDTERRECVSSLVGRVLITDSTPGSICHAHFLAAMVAYYVKLNNIILGPSFSSTPAHAGQNPQGEPALSSQKEIKMRKYTAITSRKQKYWPYKVGRKSNQACVQYRARAALAKAKCRSADNMRRDYCTKEGKVGTAKQGSYEAAAL